MNSNELTERGEHVLQICRVDEAVPILVDHVERLLQNYRLLQYSNFFFYTFPCAILRNVDE